MKKKIIDFLLLSGYAFCTPNLLYGKAGIALALFKAARHLNDETLEDDAFDLFKESLSTNTENCYLDTGKAGIGWALKYLINQRYIDGEYRELYGEEHSRILEYIGTAGFKSSDIVQVIHFWFFILQLKDEIDAGTYRSLETRLLALLYEFSRPAPATVRERNQFFLYSAKTLALYNIYGLQVVKPLIEEIFVRFERISRDSYLCNDLNFIREGLVFALSEKDREKTQAMDRAWSVVNKNLKRYTRTLKSVTEVCFCDRLLKDSGYTACRPETYFSGERADDCRWMEAFVQQVSPEQLVSLKYGMPKLLIGLLNEETGSPWSCEDKLLMCL